MQMAPSKCKYDANLLADAGRQVGGRRRRIRRRRRAEEGREEAVGAAVDVVEHAVTVLCPFAQQAATLFSNGQQLTQQS